MELGRRLGVNAAISLLTFAAAALVVSPASTGTLAWTERVGFGLLQQLALPPVAEFLITFLLLDFSFYLWHVMNHRIGGLWRFHLVHHIDPDLDVTTAFRFHFGEVLLSAGFRVVHVLLIGPALTTYIAYEMVFQLGTLFHHSNLRLPLALERALNLLLVTPRMHGIHHSRIQSERDTNVGVIFTAWDRLFGSLKLNRLQEDIVIGVEGYDARSNRLWRCLTLPFRLMRQQRCGFIPQPPPEPRCDSPP